MQSKPEQMLTLDECTYSALDDVLKESLNRWGISQLTDIQRLAIDAGICSGTSVVACAPTSSGKTLLGELAIHQALRSNHRCVYLVPHKALANQKFRDFQNKFGGDNCEVCGTVCLSTGDTEEGDLQADIQVSTYEKALGLVLTRQISPLDSVIIADELQIVGEPTRGPNIETLCAILRKIGFRQFVGLTATADNPRELAEWLGCTLVQSYVRSVGLKQEIWFRRHCFSIDFGQEEGQIDSTHDYPNDLVGVVHRLLDSGRAPVLVFTESRREASAYARDFARYRQRHADGIGVARQLTLFSEPTELAERLQYSAERRVALHTADLTPEERQVIEQGFLNDSFDVCFATPTLASGVNFPFRTVVFPKLTYEWGPRRQTRTSLTDYRNMSGRAGRLGLHSQGFSILLPANGPENRHANSIVLPENEQISSKLLKLSMRRTVLTLLAANIVESSAGLREFFENTFYWHQTRETNPAKLDQVVEIAETALQWLATEGFAERDDDSYRVTPLGQATAHSGLLPSTVRQFVLLLKAHLSKLVLSFDDYIGALVHWICCSDEFSGNAPSRFLRYPSGGKTFDSSVFLANINLVGPLDRTNFAVCQNAHALILFIQGIEDRKITYHTRMSSGDVYQAAIDVSWVAEGLHLIAAVPDLSCPQEVGNKLALFARRIRWGAPSEALDLIRIAARARVPGFGRQRAIRLVREGASTIDEVLNLGLEKLTRLVGDSTRAASLLEAIDERVDFGSRQLQTVHRRLAEKLGIGAIVLDCSQLMDTSYEQAIVTLLERERSWQIVTLDNGEQQNVPDVLISLEGRAAIVEMKTTTRRSGLLKKEASFAVLQKGADFDHSMARVTLGKPDFDETSKSKAIASRDITLVSHANFMEAALRVLAKEITPIQMLEWIMEPGLAEFDRIPGRATYLLC